MTKHEFAIESIKSRSYAAEGGTINIQFRTKDDELSLIMNRAIAAELIDSLAALDDEAMAKQTPSAAGMTAGAYRNAHNVSASPDATGSVVLIDFDRGAHHRVGVAIPIEREEALGQLVIEAAKRARLVTRDQRPQ